VEIWRDWSIRQGKQAEVTGLHQRPSSEGRNPKEGSYRRLRRWAQMGGNNPKIGLLFPSAFISVICGTFFWISDFGFLSLIVHSCAFA
jgi:hypothetical protein